MKDPGRLLATDATRLERILLEAVANERPSRDHRLRMRAAIGLAVSGIGAGSIKLAAAAWGRAALLAVVATGAAGNYSSSAPVTRRPELRPLPRLVLPARPSPPNPVLAVPRGVTPPSESAVPATKASSAPVDLREEIRLIDQARVAVRQQATDRALERLARYQARFPRGAFRQEATVLRIEALAQRGEQARARTLARQFLAEHPDSPHAERVTGAVASGSPVK